MKKFVKILALSLVFVLSFTACADKGGNKETSAATQASGGKATLPVPTKPAEPEILEISEFEVPDGYAKEDVVVDKNATRQQVKFTMENGAYFVVELYPEYAPKTCENFVKLVEEGYYDGLTFHRIISGFMAQGGNAALSGKSDTAREIPGEFHSNGFYKNTISHTRGVISMARTDDPDSASSQFFICYDDCGGVYGDEERDWLDGYYAAFGIVVYGMEVVDSFLEVPRTYDRSGSLSSPVTPIVIAKAEVVK